jgi:hypothetical protein
MPISYPAGFNLRRQRVHLSVLYPTLEYILNIKAVRESSRLAVTALDSRCRWLCSDDYRDEACPFCRAVLPSGRRIKNSLLVEGG